MASKTIEPKLFEAVAQTALHVRQATYADRYETVMVYKLTSNEVVFNIADLAKVTGFTLAEMHDQLEASSAKHIVVVHPRVDRVIACISHSQFKKLQHPKFLELRESIVECYANKTMGVGPSA